MNASKPEPSSSTVGSSAIVAPDVRCLVAARLVRVGHDDVSRAVGACELDHHDADRSRTGDEHARPSADAGFANRRDADRQRFAQRGGVIGDGVRHGVGERRTDGDVIAERPVDRRGAEEPHVRAQVVVPAAGLRSYPGRGAEVRSTRADRCARCRPTRRRRRSSLPLRGRAPTERRRRNCRSGRGGNSACRTRRRRPTTPGSARPPAPAVGTGRCSISIRPGSTRTAARIWVSEGSVVCVTLPMLT